MSMSQWSDSSMPAEERLSALVDGELDAGEVQEACAKWRDDASMRSTWHAYQLIGDVLRSDELASQPGRDAQFLAGLRERLAQEPVVLAPESVVPAVPDRAPSRHKVWVSSVAVAAGFVAVIGVLAVTQFSSAPTDALLAREATPLVGSGLQVVSASGVSAAPVLPEEPQAVVLDGRLIRDARLDQYLAAHKKFGGSSAPGVPSGFLRSAAADGTGR